MHAPREEKKQAVAAKAAKRKAKQDAKQTSPKKGSGKGKSAKSKAGQQKRGPGRPKKATAEADAEKARTRKRFYKAVASKSDLDVTPEKAPKKARNWKPSPIAVKAAKAGDPRSEKAVVALKELLPAMKLKDGSGFIKGFEAPPKKFERKFLV